MRMSNNGESCFVLCPLTVEKEEQEEEDYFITGWLKKRIHKYDSIAMITPKKKQKEVDHKSHEESEGGQKLDEESHNHL